MKEESIKKEVKKKYGEIAQTRGSCCGPKKSCCGNKELLDVYVDAAQSVSKKVGYTDEELQSVPDGANLGLGCGNPVALASLKEGETVIDLGSGAGFDCFLAANKVGKAGRVIGVDMTPEMIKKAKENAKNGDYKNVEFRLGEIENIPAEDNVADIVISNCVINLAPDKTKVFKEVYRVLKSGGRFMVSDMVWLKEPPEGIRESVEAYVGCIAGAILKKDYMKSIENAGFKESKIIQETPFPLEDMADDPIVKEVMKRVKISTGKITEIANAIVSIKVSGKK